MKYLDPKERAAEKERSRQADERALASGEKSRAQLKQENGYFGYSPDRVIVHYGRSKKVA
jgi:hypothetical protein